MDTERQDWKMSAACGPADGGIMFPPPRGSYEPARRICAGCSVRAPCLGLAMDAEGGASYRHGMYGGLDPRQRILRAPQWLAVEPDQRAALAKLWTQAGVKA